MPLFKAASGWIQQFERTLKACRLFGWIALTLGMLMVMLILYAAVFGYLVRAGAGGRGATGPEAAV